MKSYTVRKKGLNKGAPRVYLDIEAMSLAGFLPGKTYRRSVDEENKRLTLTMVPNGTHLVCKKVRPDGSVLPIIDINSSETLRIFDGLLAVRIVVEVGRIFILPIASEVKRVDRLKRLKANLDRGVVVTAGISFGGGVLDHAAHAGFRDAGINATLALANEIDEGLLNHAIAHNDVWSDESIAIAAPMQELVQDDAAMHRLPKVDVLAAGIPCSGASQAGKSKRKIAMMEDHPEVGHLIASAIMVMNRIQPAPLMGCDTYIVKPSGYVSSSYQSKLHPYINYASTHSLRRISRSTCSVPNRRALLSSVISKSV